MQRFYFKKGLIFSNLDDRLMLIRRLPTNELQFETEKGVIQNYHENEIFKNWQSGKWKIDVDSLGVMSEAIYYVTPRDLKTYPLKEQEKARRRMHYIQAVNPELNKFNKVKWKNEIQKKAEEIGDPTPPCPTAVFKWWKKYQGTKSITSLVPSDRTGEIKKKTEAYLIFEDVIQTSYLNPQKLPTLVIAQKVQRKITVLNTSRASDEKIRMVSNSTIYRWIGNLRQDIVDAARLGAGVARNKYRMVTGQLEVESILERVEMDNTPLDIIVIDENTQLPLGRPNLTVAIDKYSRMILGFYISFNTPSSYSVLQCFKQAILPKHDLLSRYDDIRNNWPAFGIPTLIAVDNGMELHSTALKNLCFDLAIQILFCPAKCPWLKGTVERYLKTSSGNLIHHLPGTTFSNIFARGDYESENLATFDLATLTHLILKWIVDIYNVTKHRGIQNTPLNAWNQSAKTKTIELPVYPGQLETMTGIPTKRTVFHYGIELEGLYYNNRQLQEVRKISGENLQVDLKFYGDQVAYIDVFDPFRKEYLRVEANHVPYATNMHRETHKLTREHARRKFGEQYNVNQLHEAREEIEQIIEKAFRDKKMRQRKRAAVLLNKNSSSILSSGQSGNFKPKVEDIVDQTMLESGLDDDLPILEVLNQGCTL